ncbi:MAG: hypothetical protein HXS50_05120 [Theionarchaea archaeon]|nr:hypothetical protein [Theionarchaea archaeon]
MGICLPVSIRSIEMVNFEQISIVKEKGTRWLLDKRNPDGSVGPAYEGMGCYYRAPWTFAVCGRHREAAMALDWIRRYMFADDGDFRGTYPRDDCDGYYAYPNANIIMGAQMLRQFDISSRGMEFMLTMQDPDSGGFYLRKDQMGPEGIQDIWLSSQAGLTCLMTGNMDAAEKTASFIEKVYDQQPDIENSFYNTYSGEKGLITEFDEASKKAHVVESSGRMQYYFQPGIAAAYLCRMHMATGRDKYLDLAREIEKFAMGCKHLFSAPQVCKVGWGSALLYQITKEHEYRDMTERIVEYFIDRQYPEGYWLNVAPYHSLAKALEVTEEFVVHLDTFQNALAT